MEELRRAGHDVATYVRDSDELETMGTAEKLRSVVAPVRSPRAVHDVARLLATHRSQVLHLHNPYPLVSLSVVDTARAHGVPVVQTVHNHRHTCMKGTYLRDGHECRDCLVSGTPLPGVRHRCYRDSLPQSVVMATALVTHRRTLDRIDRFIALTPEIRESLLQRGTDPARIVVKPNAVPDPGSPAPLGRSVTYIGRVSREKGVLALLDAWTRLPAQRGRQLRIAGAGPESDEIARRAVDRDDVEVLGLLDPDGVRRVLEDSALVVVPSLWAEALPLVVLEAMAAGRPLLVTDQGGLPAVVGSETGLVVPASVDGIEGGLATLLSDRALLEQRGSAARAAYEQRYSPSVVTRELVAVYESVVAGSAGAAA